MTAHSNYPCINGAHLQGSKTWVLNMTSTTESQSSGLTDHVVCPGKENIKMICLGQLKYMKTDENGW